MVNNDDLLSIQLMKDLLIPIYVDIWNNQCIYNKTHKRLKNGALILRSTRDIGKSFARKIINKEMDLYGKSSNLTDGIFYSDSNSFQIINNNGLVSIFFTLNKVSNISIRVFNLDGKIISQVVNDETLDVGSYENTAFIKEPGTYLVYFKESGTLNIKKVIIN